MSGPVWVLVIAAGYLLLLVVVILFGMRLASYRGRARKPPHVVSPRDRPHRDRPQDWPSDGHG